VPSIHRGTNDIYSISDSVNFCRFQWFFSNEFPLFGITLLCTMCTVSVNLLFGSYFSKCSNNDNAYSLFKCYYTSKLKKINLEFGGIRFHLTLSTNEIINDGVFWFEWKTNSFNKIMHLITGFRAICREKDRAFNHKKIE